MSNWMVPGIGGNSLSVTTSARRETPGVLPVGQGRGTLPQTVIACVLFVLIAVPLVPMIVQAFLDKPVYYPDAAFTLANFTRFVTDPEIRGTLATTALFCSIVVVFSMVF